METSTSTSLNTGYPLYDTHGNMVATAQVLNNGTSWQTGNVRQYDVWGSVRQGNPTGDPKGRYCANLGHVQDDESGLVYMRARYYEPGTGRFISEDPARDGWNWYAYANSSPAVYADADGFEAKYQSFALVFGALVFSVGQMMALFAGVLLLTPNPADVASAVSTAMFAVACLGLGASLMIAHHPTDGDRVTLVLLLGAGTQLFMAWALNVITTQSVAGKAVAHTHAAVAVAALFAYMVVCIGMLGAIETGS